MAEATAEEELSLHPAAPGTRYCAAHQNSVVAGREERDIVHLSYEQRLAAVRLSPVYYVLWTALFFVVVTVPVYDWLAISNVACLEQRENQILLSVFISLFTASVAVVLAVLNCVSRSSISAYRAGFCAFAFGLFLAVAGLNFLVALYFFALQSCYFFLEAVWSQLRTDHGLSPVRRLLVKYDLKLAGVLHLLVSLLAFALGVGFAIIKNNFKYVRQIDLD